MEQNENMEVHRLKEEVNFWKEEADRWREEALKNRLALSDELAKSKERKVMSTRSMAAKLRQDYGTI